MDRQEERPGSPESGGAGSSISVFQNYTAAEVFIQGLAGIVNQGDVEHMIRAQKQMLQRFEKTNEMLLNCNALSESRIKSTEEDFKKHIKMIGEMRKDLDIIFRKIKSVKAKLQTQYPDVVSQVQMQEDDNEDDEEGAVSQKKDESQVEYEQMVGPSHTEASPKQG